MKVLLTQDVYNLGHAGDVKSVADGYGRNYLLPRGMAVLATPGAVKRAETIKTAAVRRRAQEQSDMQAVAQVINGVTVNFTVRTGEKGKLYGSITPAMITDAVKKKSGVEIQRRQMDFEPIRALGTYKVHVRLTVDLVPEITVIVHREGETVEMLRKAQEEELEEAVVEAEVEVEE
jgi:large subunit ribosomal protein L9